MTKVEFHFDFGSPNAYLSHLVVPEIEKRTGVTFEYVPVFLAGYSSSPTIAHRPRASEEFVTSRNMSVSRLNASSGDSELRVLKAIHSFP